MSIWVPFRRFYFNISKWAIIITVQIVPVYLMLTYLNSMISDVKISIAGLTLFVFAYSSTSVIELPDFPGSRMCQLRFWEQLAIEVGLIDHGGGAED